MTNEASALLDTDANNKALDADAALVELGSDMIGQAYVTATVTVWDEDARLADEKLRLVEKSIQGRDFTCMVETVNAVEAWLGSLPGHAYANVRQPPVSTLNLAHMIPLSAVWAGPERDEHLDAPPLLLGKTEGATPFRLSIHVGDVGHTLVVGPTGAGKSVLPGADGDAVSSLRVRADLRLRLRRLDPRRGPRHGRRLARPRRLTGRRRRRNRSRCSRWRRSTIRPSVHGRRSGWPTCCCASRWRSPRR